MADTTFTAQSYLTAAQEHLSRARFLHQNARQYFLAHYSAGLAVECILRAHGRLADDEFTGRHDLRDLAGQSNFFNLARDDKQQDYVAMVNEINVRSPTAP